MKQKTSTYVYSLAAPIGGLNLRDPLEQMPETDARTLINWFPDTSKISVRKGYTEYVTTGMGSGAVGFIQELALPSGTNKLLAGANSNLYDVSTSTPSSIASSLTNNNWSVTHFANRLFLVNGADAPRDWDGTTLTSTAWTGSGLTIADLNYVMSFNERLYLIEKDTFSIWYGGTLGVTGALTKLDLSGVFKRGGYLLAAVDLSKDNSSGETAQIAFFSSEGEVAIYQGTDPGASNWVRVRQTTIPRAINANCIKNFGSDVLIFTENGVFTLSQLLDQNAIGRAYAITDKINDGIETAYNAYNQLSEWSVFLAPTQRKLYLNIPTSPTTADQFVLNTRTGAACLYTNVDAACWCLFNDQPYFGSFDGKIYAAETGTDDNGSPIPIDITSAPIYAGNRDRNKRFVQTRVTLAITNDVTVGYGMGSDFEIPNLDYGINVDLNTTDWGADWGSDWSEEEGLFNNWIVTPAQGTSGTIRVAGYVQGAGVELSRYQFKLKLGGYI